MMKASALICLLCIAMTISSQDALIDDFSIEIHKVIPPLSIERTTIDEAFTIQDIHRQYKPTWIKEFINVEIRTIQNGQTKIAKSEDDVLTAEQIKNLNASDVNSDIYLRIDYIPNNNLRQNDPKTYDATFRINPDKDAQFAVGDKAQMKSLLDKEVSNMADYQFEQYALAAIKFTVDKTGHVENVIVQESSKDEVVDQVIIDAICNMPSWDAAEFYEGSKVDQDFVLTMGDMRSCIVPTLNIKRY